MTEVEGITTKLSPGSVEDAVTRLSALIAAKGLKRFAVIDHSGEAEASGLELRETKVVVFGSPVAGTPVMEAAPLAALDLPLKVLVWADGDQTKLSYLSPRALAARYGLSDRPRGPPERNRRSDRRGRGGLTVAGRLRGSASVVPAPHRPAGSVSTGRLSSHYTAYKWHNRGAAHVASGLVTARSVPCLSACSARQNDGGAARRDARSAKREYRSKGLTWPRFTTTQSSRPTSRGSRTAAASSLPTSTR